MKRVDINGSQEDLNRLDVVHKILMDTRFNIRGFFMAADVAWMALMAPLLRDAILQGRCFVVLLDVSLLLSVLTLACLSISFRKDTRQPAELFNDMYKQLSINGKLHDGITAGTTKWYEEFASTIWPWLFGVGIIIFLCAMLMPQIQFFWTK